jgi:hypothetical protein
MRSWLFAEVLAQQGRVEHDGEVLALSTLLHDLGPLSPSSTVPCASKCRPQRRAQACATRGPRRRGAQLIWDGRGANSHLPSPYIRRPKVRPVHPGIGLDWGGWGIEVVTPVQVDTIVDAFRAADEAAVLARRVPHLRNRPATTYDNFARDFGERFVPGYRRLDGGPAVRGAVRE